MPTAAGVRYIEAPPAPNVRARGALILLHAFPLNARMWEGQLGLASRGWRVVAPHVGAADGGGPDRAPDAVRMDDYAADIIDLLDALRIEDAVFCGLSMGGYLAFAVLRRAAHYVRALVLADTKAEADGPEALDGRRSMLALVQKDGVEAVADAMVPKLLGETTRAEHPEVAAHVRSLILSNPQESIVGSIHALMSRADSTELLAAIHIPTLILVGDEDVVTPPSTAEAMHAKIAGSELVRVPAAGHLTNLERPDVFNAALTRFLDHRV